MPFTGDTRAREPPPRPTPSSSWFASFFCVFFGPDFNERDNCLRHPLLAYGINDSFINQSTESTGGSIVSVGRENGPERGYKTVSFNS